MITFDWPRDVAWRPASGKFYLQDIGHLSVSPFSGATKALSLTQIWRADLTWNNHSLSDGVDIQGLIEGLEGFSNVVRMFDFWRPAPLLLSSGRTKFTDGTKFSDGTQFTDGYSLSVVANAAKGATLLAVTGLPPSTACFKRGDLIGLGGYLYQIRSSAVSDATGTAGLWLQPGLRVGVAAGDPAVIYYPSLPMRMATPAQGLNRSFAWTEGFTLSFVEDVP